MRWKEREATDPAVNALAENGREVDYVEHDHCRASGPGGSLQGGNVAVHGGSAAALAHDGYGAGSAHGAENDACRVVQDADGVHDRCVCNMGRVPSRSRWTNKVRCTAQRPDRSRNSRRDRVHDGSGDAIDDEFSQERRVIPCTG